MFRSKGDHMSGKVSRVIRLTVALGFAVTNAAAQSISQQSISQDVTWRWTGGRTTPCSGMGTVGTFTVVVNATVDVPRSDGAPNDAILKNVSASAQSPGFRNGTAIFSLSADLVPAPPVTTGRGKDVNKVQTSRTVIRFVKPTASSVGTPRAPEDSERLVLGVMRVARGSAIRFTAAAGVITAASGTCLFGTSTYDTPILAELKAFPPPAAPQGLRVIP